MKGNKPIVNHALLGPLQLECSWADKRRILLNLFYVFHKPLKAGNRSIGVVLKKHRKKHLEHTLQAFQKYGPGKIIAYSITIDMDGRRLCQQFKNCFKSFSNYRLFKVWR